MHIYNGVVHQSSYMQPKRRSGNLIQFQLLLENFVSISYIHFYSFAPCFGSILCLLNNINICLKSTFWGLKYEMIVNEQLHSD